MQAAGLVLGDGLGRGRRQSCELYRPHGLGNASETSLGWQEKSVVRTRYIIYQTQPSPCLALDIRTDTAGDSSRGPPEIKDQTGNTSSSTYLVSRRPSEHLSFLPKNQIKETKLVDEVFCNAKVTSLRLRSPRVEVYCIGVVKNISLHDLRNAHISS